MSLRILHTIDSAGLFGAEAVLLTLAEEQRRQGHSPLLLSIGNPGSGEKPLESEARRRALPCLAHRMPDGLNLRGAGELLAIAARERADLIHSHGYKTNILLGLTRRARRGRPVVTTLHGWTAKSAWSKLGLYRFIDQQMLRRLDAVVVCSERLQNTPAVAAQCHKVTLIANGIAPAESAALPDDALARRLLDFKQGVGTLIGAVGRLSAEKNFSALLSALATASGAHHGVALLGDGPEMAALRAQAAALGVEQRVCFAGYANDARRYLPLFDALAIPSLTEGLPIILLEAMSQELPVVATRVGEIPTVLGDLGELVPPGDVLALAAALSRVTQDLPAARRRAMGAARRVATNYSAQAMCARYDSVYRHVLGVSK
jgi:glycosyltransferase involved in cell wall biosynthesis